MIIGIPKERKTLEKRVALTPKGAKFLIEDGHTVLIEKNAGTGSFFPDSDYKKSGCIICDSLAEVWNQAEMIVKVKEPAEEEYRYFREGLIIFDYLHLAGLPEVAEQLLKHKVTGIAYELVQTEDKRLPLLEPMSEIAGKLSVQNGSNFLLTQHNGRGVLLGGTEKVHSGTVTIIGAGIAGTAALKIAVGMGAKVNILDINERRLEELKLEYKEKINTVISSKETVSEYTSVSDLVILAVLVPGAKAPRILTEENIKAMPQGSVVVDISIDQGGAVENIKTTSLKEPTYEKFGVVHYAVPNMPSQVARTSTIALTKETLPYIQKLANLGLNKALSENKELQIALNTHNGEITNATVAEALSR